MPPALEQQWHTHGYYALVELRNGVLNYRTVAKPPDDVTAFTLTRERSSAW